jgi:hypothetical protein
LSSRKKQFGKGGEESAKNSMTRQQNLSNQSLHSSKNTEQLRVKKPSLLMNRQDEQAAKGARSPLEIA